MNKSIHTPKNWIIGLIAIIPWVIGVITIIKRFL